MKKPGTIGLVLASLAAAAILWTTLAAAQGPAAQSGRNPGMGCLNRFDTLDVNHDGTLTKDEFMAAPHRRDDAEQFFKAKDANGDGTLTKDEFCSGAGRGMGKGRGSTAQ